METNMQSEILTPLFRAVLFAVAINWKQSKCLFKVNGISFRKKKELINDSLNNMDGSQEHYAE